MRSRESSLLWLLATALSGMDVGVLGFSQSSSSLLHYSPSLSQKRTLPSFKYTMTERHSSRRFQASRNTQTLPFRTSLGLSTNNEDDNDNDNDNDIDEEASGESFVSRLFIAAPFLSVIFPILLVLALSFPERSSEQFAVVAVLFGANRLYLYLLSTIIVALAAFRGSRDDPRLGQRLVGLTEELLYSPSLEKTETSDDQEEKSVDVDGTVKESSAFASSPALIQSLSAELGDSLDTVSTETQAFILPLLVAASLASSVFFLQILGDGTPPTIPSEAFDLFSSFQEFLPLLTKLYTFGLLTLFTRCQVRLLSFQLNLVKDKEWIHWLVGLGVAAVAYLGVWPAQNVCNMALACLVARGIQITRFPAIVAALAALTVYDAASVLFFQPAFAASIDSITAAGTTILSDSAGSTLVAAGDTTGVASSAMGAVAMNKLTSAYFQPGLLVTRIGSNLGGALGLGDAVFPAILAIFAKRYDRGVQNDVNAPTISLFAASMVGYVVGCLACELVPSVSTSGVPALLLIAPSMLLSVAGVASIRGELDAVWNFDPAQEEEEEEE
jgi:hypothetical protein